MCEVIGIIIVGWKKRGKKARRKGFMENLPFLKPLIKGILIAH